MIIGRNLAVEVAFKIVCCLLSVSQKLMELQLMMLKNQNWSYQYIIYYNIGGIVLKQETIYGFILKMKQLILIMILQIPMILNHSGIRLNHLKTQKIMKKRDWSETIPVPLKCLSNFWRSLEMPLIDCKIEQKLRG